jgi:hypothetical protein
MRMGGLKLRMQTSPPPDAILSFKCSQPNNRVMLGGGMPSAPRTDFSTLGRQETCWSTVKRGRVRLRSWTVGASRQELTQPSRLNFAGTTPHPAMVLFNHLYENGIPQTRKIDRGRFVKGVISGDLRWNYSAMIVYSLLSYAYRPGYSLIPRRRFCNVAREMLYIFIAFRIDRGCLKSMLLTIS